MQRPSPPQDIIHESQCCVTMLPTVPPRRLARAIAKLHKYLLELIQNEYELEILVRSTALSDCYVHGGDQPLLGLVGRKVEIVCCEVRCRVFVFGCLGVRKKTKYLG